MESTKQSSAIGDLTPSIVARAVVEALEPMGVAMPGVDAMARDALRLASAAFGHAWRDREPNDFLQEFASRAVLRRSSKPLNWGLYVATCFRLMGQGRDAGGDRRVRGARDIDAPAHDEGAALHETVAAPAQDRAVALDADLPHEVEGVADFLRGAPSKTIAEVRGVSARQGRYDTAKLIQATACSVREPGLFSSCQIDPAAWAARPKAGRGGRPSKAALAQRQAAQGQQQSLF